jgi:serine/threonine-protein kinase RsbW
MLRIASKPESIASVEHFIKSIIDKHHICEDKYACILISLTEAVNNAIIHGNNLDENKKVHLSYTYNVKKGSITFTVCDEGNGFNLKSIPDPTCKENLERCGGRGVFIIQNLADRIKYMDNGRRLDLSFHL